MHKQPNSGQELLLTPQTTEQTFANTAHLATESTLNLSNDRQYDYDQVSDRQDDQEDASDKKGSVVMIFTIWNSLMGSAIVSLPWAFQQSGIVLGSVISFTSFITSYHTTMLVINCTKDDVNFAQTCKKQIGFLAQYASMLAPTALLGSCLLAYFIIMTQMLYPMSLAVYAWTTGSDPIFYDGLSLTDFSILHVALFVFALLTIICSQAKLGFFMQVATIGVVFLLALIVYISMTGLQAMSNTEFQTGSAEESLHTDWQEPIRTVTLASDNFAPVAGIFCCGYFLHNIGVPITRTAKNPENNKRDIFLGYFFVFISYTLLGALGYIGFIGLNFADYFQAVEGTSKAGIINQNCMIMFPYSHVVAFVIRLMAFLTILTTYPIIHFFIVKLIQQFLFGEQEVGRAITIAIGVVLNIAGLLITILYPKVGYVLAYIGALSGFLIIYLLPVLVHLSQMRDQILSQDNTPEQGIMTTYQTQLEKEMQVQDDADDSFTRVYSKSGEVASGKKITWKTYYTQAAINSIVVMYGLAVAVLQFK